MLVRQAIFEEEVPEAIFDEEEKTVLQEGLKSAAGERVDSSSLEGLKIILRKGRKNPKTEEALVLVQFTLDYLAQFPSFEPKEKDKI